jgi:hypothetical protein
MVDSGRQNAGTGRLSWKTDNEGRKLSAGTYIMSLDLGADQVNLKTVVHQNRHSVGGASCHSGVWR